MQPFTEQPVLKGGQVGVHLSAPGVCQCACEVHCMLLHTDNQEAALVSTSRTLHCTSCSVVQNSSHNIRCHRAAIWAKGNQLRTPLLLVRGVATVHHYNQTHL
jgi:hypothetical protein